MWTFVAQNIWAVGFPHLISKAFSPQILNVCRKHALWFMFIFTPINISTQTLCNLCYLSKIICRNSVGSEQNHILAVSGLIYGITLVWKTALFQQWCHHITVWFIQKLLHNMALTISRSRLCFLYGLWTFKRHRWIHQWVQSFSLW